jgi:glycosyltransferase involved in cell wall biosynthesis
MRVGINCLCIDPGYSGGINSFTFGLLDGFMRVGEAHEFAIFAAPGNRGLFEEYVAAPNVRIVEIDEPDHPWLRAIHGRLPLQIKRRLLLHAPDALGSRHDDALARDANVVYVPYVPPPRLFPFPDVPTVYSIHDIQHVRYPEFFTADELVDREGSFAKCVAHAAVIQASSRYMAHEFQEHFARLDHSNVEVIPEGVDIDLFARSRHENDVVARYGLPGSFLFTPAQLWHHKNHLTILKALTRLKRGGIAIPLVLTGAGYNSADEVLDFIAASELDTQVTYLGVVPFEDVIALHQRARYLVTASLYESSSIPILEAAAAGTPIIASGIPPHQEMAEHLEMRLFAPNDDAGLARVLEEAWADEETSAAQVAANRVGIQRYSWDNAARLYLGLFERLESRRPILAGERA